MRIHPAAAGRVLRGGLPWLLVSALAMQAGLARAAEAVPTYTAVAGAPTLLLSGFDLAKLGYVTSEYFMSGTATAYRAAGTLGANGRWRVVPAGSAPFATRLVVVRPADAARFNGTVVVEWLNVTAGQDASPDWNAAHREMIRSGYAYVAVSAQKVGIDGGSVLGLMGVPLKKSNPTRYAALSHPGDAYSFDIYSQAGRLLRSASGAALLGGLKAQRYIAAGESQSAVFMTTYVNAVDPVAKVYDGFLIHSRFGSAAALDNPGVAGGQGVPKHVQLRADLRVPVLTLITETDLMGARLSGYYGARAPDTRLSRTWEVPGTAHADNYTFNVGMMDSGSAPLDKMAAGLEPMSNVLGMKMAKAINNAPQHHYVLQAALANLDRWLRTGRAPAKAALMQVKPGVKADDAPSFVADANGNTLGGVRTPWVDVPVARLSGIGNTGGPLAFLAGVCEPFDAATLARLYPGGKAEYLKKFSVALASAIDAGFILPADRWEILQLAALGYHGS